MHSLLWMAIGVAAMSRSSCKEALAKLWEEADRLDAVDLTIARLRFLPYYRNACQRLETDWDELEMALERRRRALDDL